MAVNPQTLYMEGFDPNYALRKRYISERAFITNDYDIVLTKLIGGLNAAPSKFGLGPITDTKYEWQYDGPLPISATTSSGLTAVASLGDDVNGDAVYPVETVSLVNASYLHVGMVLEGAVPVADDPAADAAFLPNELMLVTAMDYAAGTASLKRGFANTPVYAFSSGAVLTITGTAGLEDQEWVANYATRRGTVEGYWQTFFAGWKDSVIRQKFQSNYGDEGDELERQKSKIIGGSIGGQPITGLLPVQLERAIMYGHPFKGNPNVPLPSAMGGITSYGIAKPVFNTTLTYANVMSVLQTIYAAGGNVDTLIVSPDIKTIVSAWALTNRETYGASRVEREYGVMVDRIISDFGTLDIVMSRQLNKGEAFALDTSKIGLLTGIEWTEAQLPYQDSPLVERTMVYGMFGLILTHPEHHAWIRLDVAGLRNLGTANLYTEPAAVTRAWPGAVV